VPTPASAYYYHHRCYHHRYYHHRYYGYRPYYRHYHYGYYRPYYRHYHYGYYRLVLIELDEAEAEAANWRAGFYKLAFSPVEVVGKLGEPSNSPT
jgi:hypothetical protein